MIILSGSTRSLEIVLGGTVTTNQLQFAVAWADDATSPVTGASYDDTNNTTAVTMVPAPSGSDRRVIRSMSVYNADTASADVTIRVNDNSTIRPLLSVSLGVGYTLHYGDNGWSVTDSSGVSGSGISGATNLGSGDGLFTTVSGTNLQFKSLTAGSNITLTPSGTEIEIASTGGGGGGLTWNVINTNTNAVAGNGYIGDVSGGTITVTLPATPTAGDEVIIHCYAAGSNTLSVAPNGSSIRSAITTVTSSDTLTLDDGQTVYLVARTSSSWEVV